jgi:hypothetical protein
MFRLGGITGGKGWAAVARFACLEKQSAAN